MFVSVIIPVHNTSEYVTACIESILNQNLNRSEFEIIIVENTSTDNSYEVCLQLKDEYKDYNIEVIKNDISGVGHARNKGIELAKGEYIHFVDSDDKLSAGMYDYIRKISVASYDILVTGIINNYTAQDKLIYETSDRVYDLSNVDCIKNYLKNMDAKEKVWTLNVIWNKWYRRSVIIDNKIRFRTDVNLGEDFVFNCTVFEKISSLYIADRAFYHYMHRERTSLVNKFREDVLYRRPIMYKAYCGLYEQYNILEEKKDYIDSVEGKLLFGSLYTVFNKDCQYTKDERIKFIKEIVNNRYFVMGKNYIKNQRSVYHRLLGRCLDRENYKVLYVLLGLKVFLEKLLQNK